MEKTLIILCTPSQLNGKSLKVNDSLFILLLPGRGSKSEAACAKFNSGGKTIYLPVGDSDTLRPGLEVLSGRESRREDAYDEVNAGHEAIPLIAPNSTSGGSCCSMRCSLI